MEKSMTCYEMLIRNCDPSGHVIFDNHDIPMSLFLSHIESFAHSLKNLGFEKGDVLTIYLPTCPQAVVAFYACSKLGVVANIVHPLIPLASLKENMQRLGSKGLMFYDILVKDHRELKDLGQQVLIKCSVSNYVRVRKLAYSIYALTRHKPAQGTLSYSKLVWHNPMEVFHDLVEGEGEDVVCTMHSGGTTGEPRIVRLQNDALNRLSVSLEKMYTRKERKGEFGVVALPIFHAYGLGVAIHTCLTNGYSVILMPKFWPKVINKYIRHYNVTFFACVPIMIRKMMECNNFRGRHLAKLKDIWCGGDVVSEPFVEYVDTVLDAYGSTARVMRGYGLTEVASVCAVNTFENYKKKSCGKPIPDTEIEIWDGDGNVLKPNTVGEIVIVSDCAMKGYVGDDTGVIEKNGKKYVKTGDLGILDDEGYLFVYDRKKRSVKISAVNVFPSEIEDVVKQLPVVDEACAVGYHYNEKAYIKLFVTLTDPAADKHAVKKQIIEHCEKHLIKYSVPKVIEIIDEMPRTNIGKIDYKKLSINQRLK